MLFKNQQFKAPISNINDRQVSQSKASKWRYFFIAIGALQMAGIALFVAAMLWAVRQADAGVSGTEFIPFVLFATVSPAIVVLSLLNVIGLPVYIKKYRPQGKWLVLSILSLAISALLVLYGVASSYSVIDFSNKSADETKQAIDKDEQAFQADNAKPEISKEEAIELIKTCKLKGFYYTNQTDKKYPANGGWGELSSTGVVLTKIEGQPYRISIADRLIPELVPIAREAQKTCPDLQFWHDGSYEQFQDGKWYFQDQVVNQVN